MNEKTNIDRADYLRVTQVLAPFAGLALIPENVLQAAGERGTKVHAMCDAYIKGFPIPEEYLSEYPGYFDSFLRWIDQDNTRRFLRNPGRMYDDKNKLTGECDAIYGHSEGLTLIDFKTSAKESKTWPMQGKAYEHLLALTGINVERIIFIKLDKKGHTPEIFDYSYYHQHPTWWDCFNMYHAFFNTRQEPFEDII